MTNQRERFEAWAEKHWRVGTLGLERCPHMEDEYIEPEMQDHWEAWQAACPDGWQAVPISADLNMLNAGHEKQFGRKAGPTSAIWSAMLAAAPTPEDV